MPISRPLRILVSIGVLGVLLWKYAPSPTRTFVFKEQNCQCQIPYNWTLKNNATFIMEARRPTGGSFFIAAHPVSPTFRTDDPSLAQGFKNKLITDGYEILNENIQPFKGQKTYTVTFRKKINNKLIITHSVNFIAGNILYGLELAKRDTDPTEDSQLQDALNSFSLITPP